MPLRCLAASILALTLVVLINSAFTVREVRRSLWLAATVGLDITIALSDRVGLLLPLRLTVTDLPDDNEVELGLGRYVWRGGAGVVVNF